MRVAVLFEASGIVREAFRARGHAAVSVDLRAAEDGSPDHLQCNALYVLDPRTDSTYYRGPAWDLVIAHPPCTYLSSSGLHWNLRRPGRADNTAAALALVRELVAGVEAAGIPRLAIENPIGILSTALRRPDQILQPWQFGDDAAKATCFWLYGLPPLVPPPGASVRPRVVGGRGRWSNQTDAGQNRLPPSPDRARLRSLTYPGIAAAMAAQWGALPARDPARTWGPADLFPVANR